MEKALEKNGEELDGKFLKVDVAGVKKGNDNKQRGDFSIIFIKNKYFKYK